ncbi:hypothetical protein [Nostoc sp. PCC 9305]|uniref:hypothetical protein n=1 Tax=Nostoc sp. PCC 9305 TaxID=296636 RepID=UPI0039C616E0
MEIKILLFWLFLISFFLRLAFLLTQAHQKTQSRYQTTRKKSVRRSERKQQYHFSIPKTGKWQKLLTLVQGDVATAKRLIEFE